MRTNKPHKRALIPLLLGLLLIGCSHEQRPPNGVTPPQVRPLPSEARQGTRPPECIPTCSKGLERSLDGMLI